MGTVDSNPPLNSPVKFPLHSFPMCSLCLTKGDLRLPQVVSFLIAIRAEHSVPLWHPVVAYFSGANTIGEFPECIKLSTPNSAKQIPPFTATDSYSFPTVSKRFIAVCAGNILIDYTPSSVCIELSESNPLNKRCHSHFSYNLKHHLACPPTRHHRCRGCKKCCSLACILISPSTISV